MLTGFSVLAIVAGLGAALVVTALAGLTMGAAISSDIKRDILKRDPDISEERLDEEMEDGVTAAFKNTQHLIQITVLSLVGAAIGGAVTAYVAGHAALINVLLTALIIGLVNLYPTDLVSARFRLLCAALTLPATFLGAWIMGVL